MAAKSTTILQFQADFFDHLHTTKKKYRSKPLFINRLFWSAGCTYLGELGNQDDSIEKLIGRGYSISANIISSFPKPIKRESVLAFLKDALDEDSLPTYLQKFSMPKTIEEDFGLFCEAVTRQFALIIEKAPNEAENIVAKEYKKLIDNPARAVTIPKTLVNTADFGGIFTAVSHGETLSITNESQLNLFHLNPNSGKFEFQAMESFLVKNIIRYVHNRNTINSYDADQVTLAAKAIGAFSKAVKDAKEKGEAWFESELGNVLIYTFLEQVLDAPKIYNKIELLKTGSTEVALSGGGVHLYNAGDDTNPVHQLVFGKSHISADITTAINNAIAAVKEVVSNLAVELSTIENSILATAFPENTAEQLRNILVPAKSKGNQAQNSFGVFIGYNLSLAGIPNRSIRADLAAKMAAEIKSHAKYISDKIVAEGLDLYSFYFYFLPFNDADKERRSVLDSILEGGS